MKPSDFDILLREGEGSMLEYKESLSSSFVRELVAFANSTGGKILLGVRDNGSVVGVRDSNHLRAQIQDMARNCDPPVKILVEPIGKVLMVTVRENESKPVQCREGFSGVREQAPRSSRATRYGTSSVVRVLSAST